MHDSLELPHEQCEQLLRAGVVGRVAVSTPTGPHIVPVNYSVVGDAIIVRTSPYSVLGTYGRSSVLAVEIDQFDHEYQRGWSVLARGRADVVTEAADLEHIRAVWAPRPWAAGTRTLHLRVPWSELSGRRLGVGWDVLDSVPVYRTV